MPLVEFNNVTKVFYTKTAETTALQNVSFEIEKGEFVAVLGPSGCGKTTILSLVSGIVEPTSGQILIGGQPPKQSNKVGYMLQHDHLFEWRTIYKNVVLGPEVQRRLTEETVARAYELLEKYGLKNFARHYPQQLSGGMRQRVALIRTLALDPDVLLLDEPFSALDYQTRLRVCDDVYSIIKKENKTAILVTHDLSEAISLADRIIILTARPANVLRIHETKLSHIETPLRRREAAGFSAQFERIWQELSEQTAGDDAAENNLMHETGTVRHEK